MATYYSHSKLSTFEQCPFRFKLRYIDKVVPEIENFIEAFLGSAVHNTLEWLYLQVKEGEVPSLDDVVVRFASEWNKGYSSNIEIVRYGMTSEDYYNKGIKFLIDSAI